jgi:hypothetical protein
MKPFTLALLSLAVPASIAFSAPAEAKRFRFPGVSKPAAKPATPTPGQPAARGGSTLIFLPGIGAAQAATQPDESDRQRLDAARREEQAEAERKEAARQDAEGRRASVPAGHEIPRLGSLPAREARPALPGFATLN